jgi:hypothetical protein
MKSPYFHSLLAETYIMAISLVLTSLQNPNSPDTIFAPILALSLFVLSASIMGYLFLGRPFQLYLDGHKKEAVSFFAKTVIGFAVLTVVVYAVVRIWG